MILLYWLAMVPVIAGAIAKRGDEDDWVGYMVILALYGAFAWGFWGMLNLLFN